MLTKNSYIALDMFSKSVSQNKNPSLNKLCSFFETIEVDYEITSSQDTTKQISYESLHNENYIDSHLYI